MPDKNQVPSLSVIIPSYNERENLEKGALQKVADFLDKQKYSWEVVVSDDGSPDEKSRVLAKEFCHQHPGFTFLENEHGGKPLAIWAGIKKSRGEIVLFSDMDQSTPISEVEKLLPQYDQGFDVVIGSRGTNRKNSSLFRLLASTIFREVRRTVLLPKIIDTQAGFKSLKRDLALEIFPRMQIIKESRTGISGWKVTSFDVEMLFIADKWGYKIVEVPIEWENRDLSMATKKSSNKGKFVQESLDMLRELYRVKVNDLKGYYSR